MSNDQEIVQQVRDRWTEINRRTEAAVDTIWNDDALVDDIVGNAWCDVMALLDVLDRMRESLVNPPQMRDWPRGRYEPDRWPDP
jgi:hypothetical protein